MTSGADPPFACSHIGPSARPGVTARGPASAQHQAMVAARVAKTRQFGGWEVPPRHWILLGVLWSGRVTMKLQTKAIKLWQYTREIHRIVAFHLLESKLEPEAVPKGG